MEVLFNDLLIYDVSYIVARVVVFVYPAFIVRRAVSHYFVVVIKFELAFSVAAVVVAIEGVLFSLDAIRG